MILIIGHFCPRLFCVPRAAAVIPFVIGNACTLPGLLIGMRMAWKLRHEIGARASQPDAPAVPVREHTATEGVWGQGPPGKVRV